MRRGFLTGMVLLAVLCGCREEPPVAGSNLEVPSRTLLLSRLNARNSIRFRSDSSWRAETDDGWIQLEKTHGAGSDAQQMLIVRASDIYGRQERTGEVRISSGKCAVTVAVTQQASQEKTLQEWIRRVEKENHAYQYLCAHRANTYEGMYLTKDCPENTVAAVERAIEKGMDFVEIDVRRTKDGVLVCCHDDYISNVTTGTGNIADLTYADICAHDMTIRSSGRQVRGVKMSTLSQILKAARGRIWVDLDLVKDKSEAFVRAAVDTIAACGMLDEVIIYTGSSKALAESYTSKNGRLTVLFWADKPAGFANTAGLPTRPIFHFGGEWGTTAAYAGPANVHEAGYIGFSNLLDDDNKLIRGTMTALQNATTAGVDIPQTDYGDHENVQKYLKEKKLR